MANINNEVIGIEELTLYDNLIKQYINFQYPKVSPGQIDDLFPTNPDPNPGGGDDPVDPNPGGGGDDPVEPTPEPAVLPQVSFSGATEEQFATIINGYYSGDFTLNQIQSIWHVGDTRSININAIPSGTTGESHLAQTVTIQILGFGNLQKGNLLTTPINGIEKALMTVDFKDCYCSNLSSYYDRTTINGYGYMDAKSDSNITWENCDRRYWCNNEFYNALPLYIKNLIKTVTLTTIIQNKTNNTYSSITTQDKVFLHGIYEVNCADSQYLYEQYKWENRNKRIKRPYRSDGIGAYWWCRDSIIQSSTSSFVYIQHDGVGNSMGNNGALPNNSMGIVPVWCM